MINIRAVLGNVAFCLVHKGFSLAAVHEYIVDVGANLPGIELLDEHDSSNGFFNRVVWVNHRRGLTA